MFRTHYSIFCLFIILFAFAGCGKVTYSIESKINEQANDGQYNRYINIISIDTNSKHCNRINDTLQKTFLNILDDYMKVPADFQNLVIDSTVSEIDGILCISVISNLHLTYRLPLTTKSIYFDIENDILYSLEEYMNVKGIDLSTVSERLNGEYAYKLKSPNIEGMFYLENKIIFIVQLTDLNELGVPTDTTVFYNYTDDFIINYAFDFTGFEEMKNIISQPK